ncbi:hypothetical protein LCGC14_2565270, partial [marine sediment metagenome]
MSQPSLDEARLRPQATPTLDLEVALPIDEGLAGLPRLFDSEWVWQAFCAQFGTPEEPPQRLRARELLYRLRAERTSPAELLQELLELEMPFELAEATRDFEVTRLELRLAPPPPEPEPFFETPEGKLRVRTLREAFRDIAITEKDLQVGLIGLEMPASQARAFAALEVQRLV